MADYLSYNADATEVSSTQRDIVPHATDTPKTLLQLFTRFLLPFWKTILLIAGLNVLVGVLTSVRPLVVAPALDAFINSDAAPAAGLYDVTLNNLGVTILHVLGLDPARQMEIGAFTAGFYLGVSLLIAGLGFLAHVLLVRCRSLLGLNFVSSLHRHLLTLPLGYFNRRSAGELVSRLTRDSSETASSLDAVARGILKSVAQVFVALLLLFRTDATFASIVIALGVVHVIITKSLGTMVRTRTRDYMDQLGAMSSSLFDTFTGIRVVKSFAAERYDATRVYRVAERLSRLLRHWRITTYYETPLRLAGESLVIAAVILLAFYAVTTDRLTLPGAAMFFYLAQQLSAPISELFSALLRIQQIRGSADRVLEMFQQRSSLPDGPRMPAPFAHSIEMRGVSFQYEPGDNVLERIDLTIRRGEFVALVGPSGAGKSTLADLLLRMYDVGEGAILYDGTDIREFNQRAYLLQFGVVAQECLLFNGTIRENIVYNRAEDPRSVEDAVRAANLATVIASLPAGLDTIVGDRGLRLSGGQRQRIAIARAVYARPQILLLDEATSALDSESELAVQRAIDALANQMTIVAIAHRLSTVLHADKIVVLDRGRIEAIGPHAQALERSPVYRRLFDLQFRNQGLAAVQ